MAAQELRPVAGAGVLTGSPAVLAAGGTHGSAVPGLGRLAAAGLAGRGAGRARTRGEPSGRSWFLPGSAKSAARVSGQLAPVCASKSKRAREAGMTWSQVGEAFGVTELVLVRGSSPAEPAFEHAAEWSAYLKRPARRVPVDLPGLRRADQRSWPPRPPPGGGRTGPRRRLPAARRTGGRVASPSRLALPSSQREWPAH